MNRRARTTNKNKAEAEVSCVASVKNNGLSRNSQGPRKVTSFSTPSLPFDAVEMAVGAEEDLALGDGRRRVARFTQIIPRQKFELLRVRSKDGRDAPSACDVQPPGGHHDRTPAFSAVESFRPPDFPRPAFHTLRRPWSGVDDEHMSIHDHARAKFGNAMLQFGESRQSREQPLLNETACFGMPGICHAQILSTSIGLGKILSPLQGLDFFLTINPGRCPGLSFVGLSALSIGVHPPQSAV